MLAVERFLAKDPYTNPRQAQFTLEALSFCLKHNYFEFDRTFYVQTHGTAMGANFAPSYANLTMGYWELLHIDHNNPFATHVVYSGWYMDDIIIIWDGSPQLIDSFVHHCNNNTLGLSFTHVSAQESLAFLDLELCHKDRSIYTKNFVKPTAGNSYLHYSSCHHPRWVNNIPRSQYCHLWKNCTRDDDYTTQGQFLTQKFKDKGFPTPLADEAFFQYFDSTK